MIGTDAFGVGQLYIAFLFNAEMNDWESRAMPHLLPSS
jgi:hypothetical protein